MTLKALCPIVIKIRAQPGAKQKLNYILGQSEFSYLLCDDKFPSFLACQWDQGYLQYEELLYMLRAERDYAALLDTLCQQTLLNICRNGI